MPVPWDAVLVITDPFVQDRKHLTEIPPDGLRGGNRGGGQKLLHAIRQLAQEVSLLKSCRISGFHCIVYYFSISFAHIRTYTQTHVCRE